MNSLAPPPMIRRPPETLMQFAEALFTAAGLDTDKAASVARLLLLTGMMGRRTHGLAQCAPYLEQVAAGTMTRTGAPETVRDTGATIVWDGCPTSEPMGQIGVVEQRRISGSS